MAASIRHKNKKLCYCRGTVWRTCK